MTNPDEPKPRPMDGVWRCLQCNLIAAPSETLDAAFRWAGDKWQHHHDWPVGHCNMELLDPLRNQRHEQD